MPSELSLAPDRGKMLATIVRDGALVFSDRFDPQTVRGRKRLLEASGVSDTQLLAWIGEASKSTATTKFLLPEAPKALGPARPMFAVRGIEERRDTAKTHPLDTFVDVLPGIPIESVAEWDDTAAVCCLDVDYHEHAPPTRAWLEAVVLTRVAPKPAAWHFSRSGGLHLFYLSVDGYRADELAAVAAIRFRAADAVAGLELKKVVRGPGAAHVHVSLPQDTGAAVLGWFGREETDEGERDEWLEARGMSLDARYDHEHCPIDPSGGSSHATPVCVSSAGVFCFKCESSGRSLGCRRPGFAPWSAVLGSPASGEMGIMIRHLTHWGHARWVLTEKYNLPLPLARLAYAAALKTYHTGTDREALIPSAFCRDTDDLARSGDRWVSVSKSYTYPRDILPMIGSLPAAQYVAKDGSLKTNAAAACDLSQLKDQTDRGYPNIDIVHGFKMTGTFLASARDPAVVAVTSPKLLRKNPKCAPRYVRKKDRMSEADAWAEIETVAPGIDRTLVKVALAGFASAQETKAGLQPIVFVDGPTGAAKTSTLKFAAGIYGGMPHEATYTPDVAKMRQNIQYGAQTCPVVIFNEILKDSSRGRNKLSVREALDPILNYTPDSASWVAYVGPVKMGRVPALFLTEPVCPMQLKEETQLARRIRHHTVSGRKDAWPDLIAKAGLGNELDLLRTVSDRMNKACDAILSYVCDEWFSVLHPWDAIADAYGVKTIEKSPNFDDLSAYLKEFFRLVCLAPEPEGRRAKGTGGGYKAISRNDSPTVGSDEDSLLSVYTMFADGGGSDWLDSRRLKEKDWSGILKAPEHVHLDMKTDGVNVYVRFRCGPINGSTSKINQQIIDPTNWESVT